MCTLVAIVRAGAPLIVAANRDERLARPASAPRRWPGEDFFAPKDETAGGTWLGLHARGVFVGVTNRSRAPHDPERESRGMLVVEALRKESARAVHDALASLDPRRFNAFHLFYADATDALLTWSDGDRVTQQTLGAGVHAITERSFGGDDARRRARILAHVEPLLARGSFDLEELAPMLREHDPADPLAATCVHVPALGYGTRSSLLLSVAARVSESRFLWADGPPCTTPYTPLALDI